jgi:hypothetical protein
MTVNMSVAGGALAQFFDNSGNILSGGKIYTYAAGTTTPQTAYTTSAGNVAWSNPIELDAAGRVSGSGEIWLTSGVLYKFVLKTSADVLLATYDNITGNGSGILATLASATGASLIGYIQDYSGSVATTVQTALRRTVWVEDFLPAGFNYGTDDATSYIQAAISSGASVVHFGANTYRTTTPIYIDGNISLLGEGGRAGATTILKTTTTVGTGSNTARGGTKTDSYAQNAILIFRHADNSYTYNVTLKGLRLSSNGYIVNYGIYAPRTALNVLEDVYIFRCETSWFTYDAWLNNFQSLVANSDTQRGINGGPTYGWATTTYGFRWADDGSGGGTGTSLAATDCWARDCDYGWQLQNLAYSSLTSCAADNISASAYRFLTSRISLNGCGLENVQIASLGAIYCTNSTVVMNACNSYAIYGNTSGTGAFIFHEYGTLTLNNCYFPNFTVPNLAANYTLQNGATVNFNGTTMPTNGNSFVSFSSNSQEIVTSTNPPYIRSASAGLARRYYAGRVDDDQIQEKKNVAIAAGGTVIATFTVVGSASVEGGVCSFTVSHIDTVYPSAVGMDKFLVSVYQDTSGGNYREEIVVIKSTIAGVTGGVVTPPTYSLSRVGNVWSLTMTPAHGACTAKTITAEFQNLASTTLALV